MANHRPKLEDNTKRSTNDIGYSGVDTYTSYEVHSESKPCRIENLSAKSLSQISMVSFSLYTYVSPMCITLETF
jgi:hypothetical protein